MTHFLAYMSGPKLYEDLPAFVDKVVVALGAVGAHLVPLAKAAGDGIVTRKREILTALMCDPCFLDDRGTDALTLFFGAQNILQRCDTHKGLSRRMNALI